MMNQTQTLVNGDKENGMITIANAKKQLRSIRMTMRNRQDLCDHFRVNFIGGDERTAYYTDDLQDALSTGVAMAARGVDGEIRHRVQVVIDAQ